MVVLIQMVGKLPFMKDLRGNDNDGDDASQQTVQRVSWAFLGFLFFFGTCCVGDLWNIFAIKSQ